MRPLFIDGINNSKNHSSLVLMSQTNLNEELWDLRGLGREGSDNCVFGGGKETSLQMKLRY